MAQNPFPKALLQEVLADSKQNLERCATLLVCVGVKVHEYFAHMEPFHLKPVIIWKGNGATTAIKNEYYDPSTLRAWTPKGVVNQTFIKKFFFTPSYLRLVPLTSHQRRHQLNLRYGMYSCGGSSVYHF